MARSFSVSIKTLLSDNQRNHNRYSGTENHAGNERIYGDIAAGGFFHNWQTYIHGCRTRHAGRFDIADFFRNQRNKDDRKQLAHYIMQECNRTGRYITVFHDDARRQSIPSKTGTDSQTFFQ